MTANSRRFLQVRLRSLTVLAGLLAASCEPQPSPPQQVQASSPSVTYRYRGDQELLQAHQNATTFCNQYQSVPRTASFTNDPDGSKVVIFECVTTTMAVAPAQFNPNLTYTYQTDRDLLDASRNAQTYCMNSGSQQVVSSIVTNANGTRTVTFQCSPR